MITHLNSVEEFDAFIKQGNVVIDFFATWCGPCRMLSPILEEISEEDLSIKVAKVDVDEISQIAARYGIASIPTLFFFKNGTLVADQVGFIAKEDLVEKIANAFAESTFSF